jgi:outer membrane protein
MFKPALSKTAVVIASLLMVGAVSAKEMKIAVVDYSAVMQQIPQAAKAEATINGLVGGKMEEAKKLDSDFKFNVEKLKRDGATMSADQKKKLEADTMKIRDQLENLVRQIDETRAKASNEERNKIIGLMNSAVEAIAAKEQYDIVLQKGATAFVKADYDITSAVVAQVSKAK